MLKTLFNRGTMLVLCGCLATVAMADDRPADKILTDIKAVELPKQTAPFQSQAEMQEFVVKLQKAMEQKSKLIGELYKADPNNAELVSLLPERWQAMSMSAKAGDEATANAEINEILTKSKNEKLAVEAAFTKVFISFRKAGRNAETAVLLPAVDEFIEKYPKDERGSMMLSAVASMTKDDAQKDAINKRLEKEYPDSPPVKALAAERRQKESIGKPFELEFTDAIKGSQVSMKALKGKVVIVDFWATWCGPCIAEMPNMKKLYAEYKDKGVEFIGISLDQPKEKGGYDKLKAYVEKNDIQWPQYYQGNFWQSEFSSSWGVNGIPCVFAIDADGNMFSTEARGKLETMIPELLAKAKKSEAKP